MISSIPCCAQMRAAIDDDDNPIDYIPKFREVGVRVLDGGSSLILLAFCPWCGKKLPSSLRNEWFDELERRQIDPHGNDIPPDFLDGRWYKARDQETSA
jgi:hypothetical protein